MSVTASITKVTRDRDSFKVLSTDQIKIEAAEKPALFAKFFKDFDNRYKYVSGIGFKFDDEALQQEYRSWIATPANYAAAGGDMW